MVVQTSHLILCHFWPVLDHCNWKLSTSKLYPVSTILNSPFLLRATKFSTPQSIARQSTCPSHACLPLLCQRRAQTHCVPLYPKPYAVPALIQQQTHPSTAASLLGADLTTCHLVNPALPGLPASTRAATWSQQTRHGSSALQHSPQARRDLCTQRRCC